MLTLICGTNRPHSLTRQVLAFYQTLLEARGIESRIVDLAELPTDLLVNGLYRTAGANPRLNQFQAQIDAANKFVLFVPEYNGSFPGALKLFLDALRYPNTWQNKKIALVGLSAGVQGSAASLSHLTDIFHYLGAEVLGLKVKMGQINAHFAQGKITNKVYVEFLEEQINRFMQF